MIDRSTEEDSPDCTRWALGLGVLIGEGEDLKPVDSCEAANGQPTLAFARPLSGTLLNLSSLRFRVRNHAGDAFWQMEGIAFPLRDRGEVCISAMPIPPEIAESGPGTLLHLMSGEIELAVAPLSQSLPLPAPKMPVPAEEARKVAPRLDAEGLLSECSVAISEWEEISAECAASARQLDAARHRLATLGGVTERPDESSARSLLGGLLAGKTEWIGKFRELLVHLETELEGWRNQLAVFGPDDSERARLLVLLREAEQTRRFYQMEDWGWLKTTENLRERRAMIETYLTRDEHDKLPH